MEAVVLAVAAVAAILLAGAVAKKIQVAAPLLLVALGAAVSLLPSVEAIAIEPEWVLAGVLPPLLYSAAVRMPVVDFRRNLVAIGGFSVVLVLVTAVTAGLVIHAVYPRAPLHVAIALGAVISPTDAAATSVIKRLGAPTRVATVLDGESLLNDPTALVTLRAAIAGGSTLAGVAGDFFWALAGAGLIGFAVGWVGLRIGARIQDPVSHTLFSFLTPFVAYLPAERLGSSGLVAVVVAGLVWGQGSHRLISARNRLSQRTNWATVDTLAEGAVFLAMGLQVFALFEEFGRENDSLAASGLTVVAALAAVLAVRAVFAGAVVRLTGLVEARRARRLPQGALVDPAAARLGWRDGVLLEWAGLRGVVTLAAAQTLPLDTPERPAVVLIAFGVAATSLMAQGLTLPLVLGRLGLAAGAPEVLAKWRSRARARLATAARDFLTGGAEPRADGSAYSERAIALELSTAPWDTVPNIDEPPTSESGAGAERLRREEVRELRLATIRAMRRALLAETAPGELPSSVLQEAFDDLDREELAVEGGPE